MANDAKKISELGIAPSAYQTDRIVVLTNPSSTPAVQTLTVNNFTSSLRYANTTSSGVVKVGNNLSVNATGFLNAQVLVATTGNVVFTEYVDPYENSYPKITTAVSKDLTIVGNNAGISLASCNYVQMAASSDGSPFGGGNNQAYSYVVSAYVGDYVQSTNPNACTYYWAEKDFYANGMTQQYGWANSYSYGFSISPNDGYGINIQPSDGYNNILTVLPTGDHDIHLFESGTGGAITLGDYGQSHISVYGPGGNDTAGNNANEILIHLINNTALTIVTNDTNYEWKFTANGVLTLPNNSGDIQRNGVSVLGTGQIDGGNAFTTPTAEITVDGGGA